MDAEVPRSADPYRPDAVLRVSELGVRFGVDGRGGHVSFSIDRGEVLALVGESGSGKTVTAQAVLGLLPASAVARGSVQLTDDPSARPAPRAAEPARPGGPSVRAWPGCAAGWRRWCSRSRRPR